jgi:hypothetical protein
MKKWGKVYKEKKVPPAAHVIAHAVQKKLKHAATEREMVDICNRMKWDGEHDFDLGTKTNLRNRIQRSCYYFKSKSMEKWHRRYASIFIRIEDGDQIKYWIVEDFDA